MEHNLALILIAAALVLLNGFFVAAEFSLVRLRATQVALIHEQHPIFGGLLAKVHADMDAYLSACQLGITLASIGLGWIGEPAVARLLEPVFVALNIAGERLSHGIAFFVAFTIISYFHIVVGELVPKSMAIRTSRIMGLWTAPPLYGFYWLMFPAIWLLNASANLILRVIGIRQSMDHDTGYSAEEIKRILRSTNDRVAYSGDEWLQAAHILELGEMDVADLMRPFDEAVVLYESAGLDASLQGIGQHRYSRYPYVNEAGRVGGIVHLKDVFLNMDAVRTAGSLASVVRPVADISPAMPAMHLLRRFRSGTPHMAIVSSGGAPIGFLTLDNVMAAIVGRIRDEFRETRDDWFRQDDGSIIARGRLRLANLGRALGMTLEVNDGEEPVYTLGGLIYWQLGRLPAEGDTVKYAGLLCTVQKMQGPRLALIRVDRSESAD